MSAPHFFPWSRSGLHNFFILESPLPTTSQCRLT